MKSPRRKMQARSSVKPRTVPESPEWVSATDVFKSPKSNSPVRRVTRRTSVYKAKKVENPFKMPASVVSPPGVKTRARRSSIYHCKTSKLASPPATRARRASMYVSKNAKANGAEVFSKVWATPVRQPEPLKEVSPPNPSTKKAEQSSVTKKASAKKTPNIESGCKPPTKSVGRRSLTPERKAKKTPRSAARSGNVTSPVAKNAAPKPSPLKSNVITSTPSKTLEEITGKSFYGTPGETPIQNARIDDVFVFSAVPKSAKRSAKKITVATPSVIKSAKKSPNRMPTRKTPAVKRRHDSEENTSPQSKRSKTSPKILSTPKATPVKRMTKSAKKTVLSKTAEVFEDNQVIGQLGKPTPIKMSPVQMTSVLELAKKEMNEGVKRKATESPSPRQAKHARVLESGLDEPTHRVIKTAKRSSPKKLEEIVNRNLSNNALSPKESVGDVSFLNETFSTDSRSSRCIIL